MTHIAPTTRTVLTYAAIAYPLAFAGIPLYMLLPEYYANEFGLSLGLMGTLLFLIRLFDAVIDPMIGWCSDRFAPYRLAMIKSMLLLFALGFLILCIPLIFSVWVHFIVGMILTTLGYSYFVINLNTLGALWQPDEAQKTRIISLREMLTILGILTAASLPFLLQNRFSAQTSFTLTAIVFVLLLCFTGRLLILWYRNHFIKYTPKSAPPTLLAHYFKALDRNGLYFFATYSLSAFGSAVPAVMLVFFAKQVLNTPTLLGLYIFLYFSGALLAIPFAKKLALKFGSRQIWLAAILGSIAIFLPALYLSSGQVLAFSIISFGSGILFSTELILPNLLLAKWVDTEKRATLSNGYYALLAFIAKFSFAIATLICLVLMDIFGYGMISYLYALLPCLLKGMAAVILWFWKKRETDAIPR